MEYTEEKIINLTVAVPPRRLRDVRNAIDEYLASLKSKYVPEAGGVMLGHSKLEILSDTGMIFDDQPYTYWKTKFAAHVFQPTPKKIFKGKIHKIQKQYLIVKALDLFTTTVTIPEAFYNDSIVQNLVVEQEIYFRLTSSSGGDYQGEIDEECIELTGSLVEQMMEKDNENIFDYAKDFEY